MGMAVEVEPPSWSGAAHTRNLASAALRMTYPLRVHGAHHMGTSGPLLLVTRCEGMLAGSILHAVAPRPLHVVANDAMQRAIPDAAMVAAGDVPISGPAAVLTQRRALAALLDERAVAVAGSSVPVGYLVAVAGVAVMPVVLLGAMGRVPTDPPRPRSRIDVFFSPLVTMNVVGDPLRASTRAALTEQVRQLVSDAEELAGMRSGRA
jgi:hypothetical protein